MQVAHRAITPDCCRQVTCSPICRARCSYDR
jgi:hypothetical protein